MARMAGCVQGNWEAQAFPYKTDLRSGLYLLFATGGTLSEMSLSLGPVLPSLESPAHLWLLD